MNIRNCRLRAGMTQAELAEKAGTSGKCVSIWENELFEPRVSSLFLIARALGVTVDHLLDSEPPLNYSRRRLMDLIDEEGEANFCDATGIPEVQVWRWRNGAEPTISTLRRLAKHFNVPVGWFYEKKERETK